MNIAPLLKTGTLRKPRIGGRRISSKTKPHKLTAYTPPTSAGASYRAQAGRTNAKSKRKGL